VINPLVVLKLLPPIVNPTVKTEQRKISSELAA